MQTIREDDIQRIIVRGYNAERVTHFVLRVKSAKNARLFLRALLQKRGPGVTPATARWSSEGTRDERTARTALNVAFTYRGLSALGVPETVLSVFREHAPAFTGGARRRAARWLGDTGSSAPEHWDPLFTASNAHVLISLFANRKKAMDELVERLDATVGSLRGFAGWDRPIEGAHLDPGKTHDRREHFGFRDGISQPSIRGIQDLRRYQGPIAMRAAPGEFLLGYENEERVVPWSRSRIGKHADVFRNGSFGAFRKIEQDVAGFIRYSEKLAETLGNGSRAFKPSAAYLRAKMCGRWPNGALVKPGEEAAPNGDPENLNDFDFSDDPVGQGCPMGSHIRRLNPRSDDVVPGRKRPLIRRGIPYGPRRKGKADESAERGLLGLFVCASLEEQFEFLMRDWVEKAPIGANRKDDAEDPLVGNHNDPRATLHLPVKGHGDMELKGLQSHLRTRGTLYAFYPSLSTLNQIALGQWDQ